MLSKVSRFAFGCHTKFAIIGGGTGGMNTAAHLSKQDGVNKNDIRVFEPSKIHAYQPAWTMVAGNIYNVEDTTRPTKAVLPPGVPLTELGVQKVEPENNTIITEDGDKYTYDYLVVTAGNVLDFSAIKGATEALNDPNIPVGSAYTKDYAQKMQGILKNFRGGEFVFHEAPMPIKCAGAPQKVAFLVEHYLRQNNLRESSNLNFYMAKGVLFAVTKYANVLGELHKEKNINVHLGEKVTEVNGEERYIVYENATTGVKNQKKFDALHLVPHQNPPKFIAESGLASADGYLDLNKGTLQHNKYKNIYGLGDCSNLPTSKTAAAVFSQTPVLVNNLANQVFKNGQDVIYEGYSSCPILVGDNKLVLAEFKYDGVVDETFPVDQGKPRTIFYRLKKDFFPRVYWHVVPQGRWFGRNHLLPNLPFYNLF